jgi:cyclic pyranopterin phosphate synthase
MPSQGVEWKPHDSMLRFEEILHLCRIMAELGIRKVRVTGGEPLLRKGMTSFLEKLKAIPGIKKVTLTTNGILLGGFLDVSLDGVNISLNALNDKRFSLITRAENVRPEEILLNIDRLLEKQVPVKINCVPVRGYNEEEIIPLAALAKDKNIAVRFIELMPLGSARSLKPVSGDETAALIEKAFGKLTPFTGVEGSGPAVYYSLPGFTGKIGFINPVSHSFCETCNRLRLTSEGFLKLCLSCTEDFELRILLRTGVSDKDIAKAITERVAQKPPFHNLSKLYGIADFDEQINCGMFGIGG